MSTEVRQFRKKPVEVEAMRWDGSRSSIQAICDWANVGTAERGDDPFVSYISHGPEAVFEILVSTPNGDVSLAPEEWVVRGVMGEFYPCRPDIFAETYEPAQ